MEKNNILVFEGVPCIVNDVSVKEEGAILTVQEYIYVVATKKFSKTGDEFEIPDEVYDNLDTAQLKARFKAHIEVAPLEDVLDAEEVAAIAAEPTKTTKDILMEESKGMLKTLAEYFGLVDALKLKAIKGKGNVVDFILANATEEEAIAGLAAINALIKINAGTEEFADFEIAGVVGAIEESKADYDVAIATAKGVKGSDLLLTEIQVIIDTVNDTVVALAAINAGTEVFADFEIAGIENAVEGNKDAYDVAIAAAIVVKTSVLTLAEVQAEVDTVNTPVEE